MRKQKVHYTTKDRCSQTSLVPDPSTGLAWLRDKYGKLIHPSADLTTWSGPVAIQRVYQAAIKAGYKVKDPTVSGV